MINIFPANNHHKNMAKHGSSPPPDELSKRIQETALQMNRPKRPAEPSGMCDIKFVVVNFS